MREHSKATVRYYDTHYIATAPTVQPSAAQPYYVLAPVQQQVLARITSDNGLSGPYPHPTHLLCPPANPYCRNRLYPGQQPATPISPGATDEAARKRGRVSMNEEGSLSHLQVMEALKARIQRGSGSGTPTDSQADRSKRPRTKPIEHDAIPPYTPSPRSAKPTLPLLNHRYDTPHHHTASPAKHALRKPIHRTEKLSAQQPAPPPLSSPSSEATALSS